jgi:hypothetical protein
MESLSIIHSPWTSANKVGDDKKSIAMNVICIRSFNTTNLRNAKWEGGDRSCSSLILRKSTSFGQLPY